MNLHPCFWNGQDAQFRVVLATVGPEPEALKTQLELTATGTRYLWFIPFIGQARQMLEVHQHGAKWYIDNEDGTGLYKVIEGMGGPSSFHRTVYPGEVLAEVQKVDWFQYDAAKQKQIEQNIDDGWTAIDAQGYAQHKERIAVLLETIRKRNPFPFGMV